LNYIIYTDNFNENVGGTIALHKLCDLLNRMGQKAYLWPWTLHRPIFDNKHPFTSTYQFFKYYRRKKRKKFYTFDGFITPIAKRSDLRNSIVIYPEIIDGNPLQVSNVVRWLLHKPGFHTGRINYGENDLYFFFQEIFNDPKLNPYPNHLLTVLWVRDDIYKQTNYGHREGVCYMVRKGKDRQLVHDTSTSILLDNLPHHKIAKIMNQCEYFISYDMETMYSQYAVLCGCKSIVIPQQGISKEQWQPKEEFRSGIAYGFDDIEEAEKTAPLVYNVLRNIETKSKESVEFFVERTHTLFKTDNKRQ